MPRSSKPAAAVHSARRGHPLLLTSLGSPAPLCALCRLCVELCKLTTQPPELSIGGSTGRQELCGEFAPDDAWPLPRCAGQLKHHVKDESALATPTHPPALPHIAKQNTHGHARECVSPPAAAGGAVPRYRVGEVEIRKGSFSLRTAASLSVGCGFYISNGVYGFSLHFFLAARRLLTFVSLSPHRAGRLSPSPCWP